MIDFRWHKSVASPNWRIMTTEEREKNVILLLEYFVGQEGWIVDTHLSSTEPNISSTSIINTALLTTTVSVVPIVTVASEVTEDGGDDDADEM